MRGTLAVLATGVLAWWLAGQAQTAPQPSEVPIRWELDFRYLPLAAAIIHVPGEPEARLFWYLRYQVTNRTGEDRIFVPSFWLYAQTGQLIPTGKGVPAYVFTHLKKLLNDPYLKDIAGVTGKLLQGDDNAKDGLAIWPDFDPQAGNISIFVEGLSGETAEINLPVPVEVLETDAMGNVKQATKDKLILTKTLQLAYGIPGEPEARLRAPVKLQQQKWIMR